MTEAGHHAANRQQSGGSGDDKLKPHQSAITQPASSGGSSLQTFQLRLTGNAKARLMLRPGSSDIVRRA